MITEAMETAVQQALAEDIGSGDVTSTCTIPQDLNYSGYFVAKADGVIAGLDVVALTYRLLDETIQFRPLAADGDSVTRGTIIGEVEGSARALLSAERVALNFLQRMSGIATVTGEMVSAVAHTSAIILDTRKTVPGLRGFDKLAVKLGGGANHRFGLFDMVLIKENHIEAAGGITQAVGRVRANDPLNRPIEVEVKNFAELEEVLPLDIDRIMLDNMSLDEMRTAVKYVNGRTPLEASGNVSLQTAAAIAETGVDYISSGMLTHSVTALDISFLLNDL